MADDLPGFAGGLAFTLFVASAVGAADPQQREQIRLLVDELKTPVAEGGKPLADVAREVADVMGPDWLPDDGTLQWLEQLTGKKFR